jgi:hypothetical protein
MSPVQVGRSARASCRAAPSNPGPERASRRPGRGAVLLMAGRLSWGRKAELVNRASTRDFRAGGENGSRRAVTRRRRRHRVRLPERRAARRAREHGCEHLSGRHTPVPGQAVRVGQKVSNRGEWLLSRAPAALRAVAAPPGRYVEHLRGMAGRAGVDTEVGRRPVLDPKPGYGVADRRPSAE